MERTKAHKVLKNADLPYEDEKFSYIAISKEKCDNSGTRILRHPMIEKGKIALKVCHKWKDRRYDCNKKGQRII